MKRKLFFAIVLALIWFAGPSQNSIDNAFFDHVPYIGAFGTTDWTAGWANWDPQNTAYPPTTSNIPAGDITSDQTWTSGTSPLLDAASFANPVLADPFFTPVTYIGAFGTTDWTSGWANWDPQNTSYPPTTVTIPAGNITTNTVWTSGNVYLLNGWVYVKNGATLTIEPGTVIRGDKNNKGALIVERGGKLVAEGTSANPIVFTSNQPAGSRTYGDWGGIILCGKATINVPGGEAIIEGGVGTYYGGGATPDAHDNSGSLKYIRIEFPGIAFSANNEINGLTMGGVGDATQIDFIQVSYCGDDSYEWFGGTVNGKHLIALRGWDDDFDTDFGFRGKIQFGVSLRDPNIADVSGSNSFESDNDGTGSGNLPITQPIFCNISVYGPKVTLSTTVNSNYKRALHLRRNTKCNVFNSNLAGWPTGLFIDGTAAQNNATNNELKMENVILSGMVTNFASTFEQNYFLAAGRNNTTLINNASLHVTDPFNLTSPNFLPLTGSTVYKLEGWTYVKNGATLTIEAGTIIRGDKAGKAALIIERGGKLIAEGTPAKPIVFTSNQSAGNRTYGDWGGVILCGKATINVPGGEAIIEGGVGTYYGGGASPDDNDNSGVLKYVRIEFPGIAFAANNEINGLTMGGVGAGTTLDYIQVSYCGDDSFEWFGGTVNAKHLIAHRGWDDEFDTDFGYRGMVQYAVALRDPNIADVSGSNGFESDNDGTGSGNTPITQPIFSNVCIFLEYSANSNYKRAMHLRRNTKINIFNTFFTGYPIGLFIDGTAAQTNATNNELKIQNTILDDIGTTYFVSSFERNYFMTEFRKNDTIPGKSGLMITDPFNLTNPNFLPLSGSPVLVRSYWTHELNGAYTYDNTAGTPLSNVTVSLKSGTTTLATATTNASGQYAFKYVADGSYTLTASTVKAHGGINSTDALFIRRHALGIITLTGLRLTAADVNLSSSVNSTAALLVQKRTISSPTPTWTAPDWLFEVPSVLMSGSNVSQNVKGICSGDVNGSYVPVIQ